MSRSSENLLPNLHTRLKDELLRWRKDEELLQKEAADILGVSISTLRKWEYGVQTPSKLALATIEARIQDFRANKGK